jgi:hypothetical protein
VVRPGLVEAELQLLLSVRDGHEPEAEIPSKEGEQRVASQSGGSEPTSEIASLDMRTEPKSKPTDMTQPRASSCASGTYYRDRPITPSPRPPKLGSL